MKSDKRKKILSAILYGLPMIFLMVAYFGITVSGEDIFQGAGNYSNGAEINVASDAAEAFKHNGRLTDVYAWTVIDFFDYQFRFGPDVIFRLLDVIMAGGIFYMMSLMVLGKKPSLNLKDALIFNMIFAMIMITQHGRVFYAGFSAIHNYMVAIFIMLLFLLPYLLEMLGKNMQKMKKVWMMIGLSLVGILFGMSSAIAPIAFLIIFVVYGAFLWFKKKQKIAVWGIMGVVGVIVGVFCSNFWGPSVGFYTSNDIYVSTYDYVSVADLLNDPVRGVGVVIKHEVVNFGRVLLPLILFAVVGLILSKKSRELLRRKTWKDMNIKRKSLLVVSGAFMVISILGASQVNAPLRILLPAYVMGTLMLTMIFEPYIKVRLFGWMVWAVVGILVVVKIGLTADYHKKMEVVLKEIRTSDDATMCIEQQRIRAYNLPVVYLGQEDMLADWAMPETIYGKKIEFCGD